jgi:hypothetical protein
MNFTDYVDASVPMLRFGGSIGGVGFRHFWGINTNNTSSYSSDFVVKGFGNTYAIGVATTGDAITAGIRPNGSAYFSGSVGIGTLSTTASLHIKGATTSSLSSSFLVQNNVDVDTFRITDDRNIYVGGIGGSNQAVINFLRYSNGGSIGSIGSEGSGAGLLLSGGASKWFMSNGSGNTLLPSAVGNTSLGAMLGIRGTGTTSSTTSFLIQNSSAVPLLTITDDGTTRINGNTQITGSLNTSGSLTVLGNIIQYNSSSYLGNLAGAGANAATFSVYLGEQAGFNAASSSYSTLIGPFAGMAATNSLFLTALGYSAGISMSDAGNSTAIGPFAGYAAYNAVGSSFLGVYAGASAVSSSYSTFIGPYAGWRVSGSSYSTFIGYNTGFNSTLGNNNIIVGTNVTLASGSSNSINIGGLIFGSGSYNNTGSVSSGSANGFIGINQPNPQFNLDVSGSARITGGAQLTGSLSIAGSIAFAGSRSITAPSTDQIIISAGNINISHNNSGLSLQNSFYFGGGVNIADNVSAGQVNTNPLSNGGALLKLSSTRYGFQLSQMTTAQRNAITSPAQGLQVYVTSSGDEGIWYFNSGSYQGWTRILNSSGSQSITGSLNITGSLTLTSASLDYQQNTSVATGSFQTVVSAATGSFRCAFFDYVAFSGSIVRAGTVVTTWSGSATEFYENYTADLGGSTSVVTLQTAISGSNIQLQAGISGSAWSVRSLVRLL